jgi:Glyoxalase-like domain
LAAVTVDCVDPRRASDFWSQLLDTPAGPIDLPGWFRIGQTIAGGPAITFQPVPEENTGKTRIHLDIWVDDLDAAISLVRDLGGRSTGETHLYEEKKANREGEQQP